MQPGKDRRIHALEAEISALRSQLAAANATCAPVLVASGVQLDQVAQSIIDTAVDLVAAGFGAFFYNSVGSDGEYRMQYSLSGAAPEAFTEYPMPRHTALFAPAFGGSGVVRSDDVLNDPRYGRSGPYFGMPREHIPVRSYLAAPVKSASGEVLGGLVFGHREPSVFTQRAERVVVGVAELAAIALQNSQLLRAVSHSEQRFKALIENSLDGIVVVDADGIIRYMSPASMTIEGRVPEEVLGTDVMQHMHPDDVPALREFLQHVIKNPGAQAAKICRRQHKDGRWLWLEGTTTNLLHDPAVRGIVSNYRDVTGRKLTEEALMRSQKMEALGTLAGGIAHDFNNLLLAITGNAKLAMADLNANHSAQRSLAEIARASRRATDLVARILAFSRQQEPQREVVALEPLIQDALQLLQATLPAMIKIEANSANDAPTIFADASQIHQVIMNLVTNAGHAIGSGPGSIEVVTSAAEVNEDMSRALGLTPGQYAHVTVSDTGCGMSSATIARIFDPFFTTKPVGQGTGLGLSVVHGIVKAHEGAIAVHSELDQGSKFDLYFPAHRAGDATTETPRPAIAQGDGERVLYIDDDEAIVYLTGQILERLGYRVTGCDGPLQGLDIFRAAPDSFDVVVTDLSMPEMSGFDIAQELRAIRPDIPILMTSGYVRPEDREAARAQGIRDVILKPNTVDELGQSLATLFQQMNVSRAKS